jgi:hypothetical protein
MKKNVILALRPDSVGVNSSPFALRSSLFPHPSGRRGIALVLTLGILAIVTLLVIAFATSMRVENMASRNFNDLIKARELAKAAVDQAVATIRNATPLRTQSAAPVAFTTYATFPGAIWDFYYTNGAPAPVTVSATPLYSWNAADVLVGPFDFNKDFWITANNGEFSGAGAAINVGWVYVADDGTVAPTPLNAYPMATTKHIIGRFAFWVDDEASKININTAGQGLLSPGWPSADLYGASHPLAVDLQRLLNVPPGLFAFAAEVEAGGPLPIPPYPRVTYPYATIGEVRRANPGMLDPVQDAHFTANQFSTTAYSDDAYYPNYTADLDVFDRQRKNVSALIAVGPGNDFSAAAGVDSAYNRLADTALARICSPPAGPVVGTFANKYNTATYPNGLQQIIANIMAYRIDPATTAPPDAGGDPPAYLGLAKTPYVNEVQVSYSDDGLGTVTRTVTVELFYPYEANASAYAAGGDTIVVNNLPVAGLGVTMGPTVTITVPAGITFSTLAGVYHTFASTPIAANDTYTYVPLPPPYPIAIPATPPATPVVVNYSKGANRLDCAVLSPLSATAINAANGTAWQGAQVGDPCVNEATAQWESYVDPFAGTLGNPNNWQAGPPPGGSANLYPFGVDVSKMVMRGRNMLSIGELGYIHRPEPWNHLILQPQPAAEKPNQIPDWAMLDIFTVGAANTRGRINVNSQINPQAANLLSPSPVTLRQVPLLALVNSLAGLPAPAPTPATIAQDIYNDNNAVRATDPYGMSYIFDTIGEICEVPSLAIGGNEADKERAIRRIANLITTRSNAFTIWVIAQSIKQPTTSPTIGTFTPGVDQITGEVRAQAVVERYEFPATPAPPTAVNFRTRYFRYIYQ